MKLEYLVECDDHEAPFITEDWDAAVTEARFYRRDVIGELCNGTMRAWLSTPPTDDEKMLALVKRINRTLSNYRIEYDDAGKLRAEIAKFAAMLNKLAAVEEKVD